LKQVNSFLFYHVHLFSWVLSQMYDLQS
jgi:hypothetical protein